jgi:hypothetical protein
LSNPNLIFQGIATLLELAPASRLKRDRLLWFLRASPSTTLDKTYLLYLNSIILVKKIFSLPAYMKYMKR